MFVFHLAWRSPPIRDLALPVWAHLDVGVEVFFVLSGFLVYRPFVAAHLAGASPPRLPSYLVRRAARVYPAYWVALAAVLVAGDATLSGTSGVIKHLTLTFTWFDDRGGEALRVAWTLVIEVSFYVLVPLWALAMRRLARRDRLRTELGGVVVLLAVGAVALWAVTSGGLRDPAPLRLLPALLGLGAGMLVAVVDAAHSTRWTDAVRWLGARPAVCFGVAATLYGVLLVVVPVDATPPVVAEPAMRLTQGLLQGAIGFFVVVPVALRDRAAHGARPVPRSIRLLSARPLVGIGLVSYGLYLWHVPVLRPVAGGLQDHGVGVAIVTAAVALAASLAIAVLSHRVVEEPANRLARRATGRRDAAAPPLARPVGRSPAR